MNVATEIGPSARMRARIAAAGAVPTDAVWRRPARMSAVDERPIRRAASVICVRAGVDGEPEVLVVRRSRESRFLPGYVAFPGGAVDAEDEAHAERLVRRSANAARAAAVRELIEETGVTLTADGLVASDGFAPTDVAPPSADQLSALCHWVAPPEVPVRFDARYFTVQAGARRRDDPRWRRGQPLCGGRRRAGSSPSGGTARTSCTGRPGSP